MDYADEDEDSFELNFSAFPSSFHLNDAIKSEKKASFECKKLVEELQEGYSTQEETIRTKNLISYLYWQLGKREEALEFCEQILRIDSSNIIALANKGRMLRSLTRFHEANQMLNSLQILKDRADFERLHTFAEAEIAYSYSRFGPRFHDKCISLFEKVISKFPENFTWKFGLALTYRRETHILNSPPRKKGTCENNASKALKLLCEISTSEECKENLRAKAWCELGQILYGKRPYHPLFASLPHIMGSLTSEQCYQRALELCPDDLFVLQKSGRQFRYFQKLDKSVECLQRARSIRETPFNLHHLALTLIKTAEVENRQFRRSLSFDSKTGNPTLHACVQGNMDSVQSLSKVMSKVAISSPTLLYRRCLSHDKTRESHLNTQSPEDSRCLNHSQKLLTPSQSLENQRINRNRGRRGKSSTQLSRDDVKHVRYPGTSSKVAQIVIKSPKKIEITPENPRLKEAVEHLKRAIGLIEGEFPQAWYDLGLVYRKLDQCDEAVQAFTQAYSLRISSKIEKIRALEQIGLCKLYVCETKECTEEQAKIYHADAKTSLYKAVSLMAGLCSLLPQIGSALNCFPTLRSMLIEENIPGNVSARRELAKLHSMMGNYKDAISFYEEIKECLQNDTPVEVLSDLLTNYERIKDFEKAIFLLNMMWVSKDTRKFIERKRYITLHILAWEFSIMQTRFELAKQYIRDVFTFAKQRNSDSTNTEDETKALILCSCDNPCSASDLIRRNLRSLCDINSLHNTEDCLPGTNPSRYMEESMDECDFILLLNSCESTCKLNKYYMEVVLATDPFRSKAVLIGDATTDPHFGALTQVPLPDGSNCMIGWIRTLLESVLLAKAFI